MIRTTRCKAPIRPSLTIRQLEELDRLILNKIWRSLDFIIESFISDLARASAKPEAPGPFPDIALPDLPVAQGLH